MGERCTATRTDTDARDGGHRTPLALWQGKFVGEGYCELFRRLRGPSTVILRYANICGPRQDPLGEGGVIAIFCGKAQQGGNPTVFGDGRQTRDYTYVGEVVAANLAAAEKEVGGACNIGRGEETSVLDLVDALRPLAENDFEPQFAPERPGEVYRSALYARRAADVLGWRPQVGVDEGLRRTLERTQAVAG